MHNKKSLELSLNFIIIMIISIVIFSLGIKFIYNLTSEATNLQDLSIYELDKQIGSLVCESAERVCIGVDRKTIQKSKYDIFGVKIFNVLDNENFEITIKHPDPPSAIGYDKRNNPISGPYLAIHPGGYPGRRIETINKNKEANLAFGVEVPKDAVPGTYILNVDIKNGGELYSSLLKIYVDVP